MEDPTTCAACGHDGEKNGCDCILKYGECCHCGEEI